MRYTTLPAALYQRNRDKLRAQLLPNSVAVLHANDILPTNSDGTMRFKQNSDLFYLTGIDQEQTILLLCPDCPDVQYREVLFIRETDAHIAIWEGHKYTKEEAQAASGVARVEWLSQFDRIFSICMALSEQVYLNTNEHLRATVEISSRDARFISSCKERFPLHTYKRLAPLLHQLRSVKEPEEVEQLRRACAITEAGFRRVLARCGRVFGNMRSKRCTVMNFFDAAAAGLPTSRSSPQDVILVCYTMSKIRPSVKRGIFCSSM
ncbi:peptidase M24 [Nitritalea halalkaliphila LW7]|uniref:Xaa-Pro aminopeptidase n=1 Tax=Nitritalea halalkaliphila LW7 TaxID=1189621 RepID=I5C0S6_9BACT|nr:peptidase M24 [Nitritalea halalkaliphila LW7]